MKKYLGGLVFLTVLILFPWSTAAEANELQQLIDETPSGETLELEGKTYAGNVVITRPITIIGTEDTLLKGDGTKNVIEIRSDEVSLESLMIKYSGMSRSSDQEYSGVRVMGDHAVLKNLTISESYHGIFLNHVSNSTIVDSTIIGHGIDKLGNQGYGIYALRSGDNVIANNYVEKTRDGIFIEYSDNNEIINNKVAETRYGLHYMYANENLFKDNEFVRNIGGAAIMHSDSILLQNNSFSYNQGSRAFGLIIQSSRDIEVRDNQFHFNQRGLYLEQSTSNLIQENEFYHNKVGVELWTSSTAHTFLKNDFYKNDSHVIKVGGESINEWSHRGVGNYWNTPMLDFDQDKVSDSPLEYTSSISHLIEENELAYLFISSPAMTIYEKMNEILGNQVVMAEDNHPLLAEKEASVFNWMTGAIILAGGAVIFIYRRRNFRWPIFGRKG